MRERDIGNPAAHALDYLPILVAGGLKHTGNTAFGRRRNHVLSNLYLRSMRQSGIETTAFSSSTGALGELR